MAHICSREQKHFENFLSFVGDGAMEKLILLPSFNPHFFDQCCRADFLWLIVAAK
jgi:hypothetical protein